jgi:ligand-binding SRPBCC domain-containing protein
MTVEFEVRTRIAAPREVVFDLSLDVDVHRASLAASNERAVGGVTGGLIGLGEDVTWRATHFGIRFTMTSRVSDLDRPRRFVDEQVRGPFARFAHEHVFERDGGGTVMIDRVSFDAPFGVFGRVVERLVLGPYLERLIETRGVFLKAEAEKRHRAAS